MHDLIVIGGGPSGITAALRARELGASVALVERKNFGGTCTNDGCVPTRVLAKAARLRREASHFELYGLQGEIPQVDFANLIRRTQQVVYSVHEKKQIKYHLTSAGVDVFEHRSVQFRDEHSLQFEDGELLYSDKFIICTGGHARHINFPGSELALTHQDVWSLKKLPTSVVIVGGAATGCQLASIFDAFGVKTSILEVHSGIIGLEDPVVSQTLEQAFQARGIQVITLIGGVERIEKVERGLRLFYTRDGSSQSLDAEAVILAVGWIGNIEQLNLPAAGVQTERGYVVVNDYLQSSTPNIFAAGDITGRMMLVQSGSYDARVAVENAILGIGQPYKHQIVPHGGFTDPEYGSVGMTETQARAQEECVVAVVPYSDMDRAVIDDHQVGYCKLIVSQETHRILGAHIVGEQALEIIQLVAAGMAADMWVEQLAELELAYPTYSAIVGLVARKIMLELGVLPVTPQWRTLGHGQLVEWEQRTV